MDIEVEIDVEEFDVEQEVKDVIEPVVKASYRSALKKVPVDSGKLKDSITKNEFTIKATAPYAAAVHNGTAYKQKRPFIKDAIREQL